MSRSFVLLLAVALLVAACRDPDPAAQAPSTAATPPPPTPDVGPEEPDLDTAVARAGQLTVTLRDFERSLYQSQLLGREMSPTALANPNFQRQRVRNLLLHQILLAEAAHRDIHVTPEQLLEAAQSFPPLEPYLNLPWPRFLSEAASATQVPETVLQELLERGALSTLLTELLLQDALQLDNLWTRYQRERTTVTLDLIKVLNVPSSREISRFVDTQPEEITAYYNAHRDQYQLPERARVRIFRINAPPSATDDERLLAKERIHTLRRKALAEDFAELAKQHSEDPFSAPRGGLIQPVTRAQLPLAFDTPVGRISDVQSDRQGFFFLKVESISPASTRELDNARQREIAAHLIKERGPAPSVLAFATEIQAALAQNPVLPEGLEARFSDFVVERLTTLPIALGSGGQIPRMGHLPEVHRAAFELTPTAPAPPAPVADADHLFAIRLLERKAPSRARFLSEQKVFAEDLERRLRPRILQDFLAQRVPDTIELQLRPIQKRHGVLGKDGSVQRP